MAVRQLGPDAHPGDVLREADAPQVDVVLVDQVVDAAVGTDLRQQGLGQLVGEVAVVEPEGSIQPFGAPPGGEAPLAALAGLEGISARGEPEPGQREELPHRAVEDEVHRAGVGAAFRVAELLPLPEVLRGDRNGVGDLGRARHLPQRPEQLLRFAARRREPLLQIERVLRVGDAVEVAAEEQRLAPVQAEAARLERRGHGAEVEVREPERVEQLARRAAIVALRVRGVLPVRIARDVHERRVRVAVAVASYAASHQPAPLTRNPIRFFQTKSSSERTSMRFVTTLPVLKL